MNDVETGTLKVMKKLAEETELYTPTYDKYEKFLDFFTDSPEIYSFEDPDKFEELLMEFLYLFRVFMVVRKGTEIKEPDGTTIKLRSLRWRITRFTNDFIKPLTEAGLDCSDGEAVLGYIFHFFCKTSKHKNFLSAIKNQDIKNILTPTE